MGVRYKRTPIVRDYVAAAETGDQAYIEFEPWTRERAMRDTVMLGLRLAEGIADEEFRERFGVALRDYCSQKLDTLVRAGVVHWRDGRLVLDPSRRFVCNSVLGEILPD
jgi:oxygen-independent coproporphyrinogen-3 oxidase